MPVTDHRRSPVRSDAMYERRLKILFGIIVATVVLLLLRAAHLQLVQGEQWRAQAQQAMRRTSYPETTRGRILDIRGRELAVDAPCIDAAVDYRAIELNEAWITEQARARLQTRADGAWRSADREGRRQLLAAETQAVRADIERMWQVLAAEGGISREEIERLKASIRQRVEMRRRSVIYGRYVSAREDRERQDVGWLRQLLVPGGGDLQIDSFVIDVAEQTEAHVILPAVSVETNNRLKKRIEEYPGLILRPSKHRWYPFGEAACHLLGYLSAVRREDLDTDPWVTDPRRQYLPNDLAGRAGIEALCEATLRGSRGRIVRLAGQEAILEQDAPVPGGDVRLTIDIDLQRDLERAFADVQWMQNGVVVERHAMYGAAVVIDVPTGQLRALVSYPTYDLNSFAQNAGRLAADTINRPLLNRATQAALEPGSTVKPLVGLGAMAQGVLSLPERITCTGYLVIDGRRQTSGKCWTMSRYFPQLGDNATHMHVPDYAPHPDNHLNVTEAVQRSCNVFFENLGDRLGLEGLTRVYEMFGLGRPVGIGLPERAGRLPAAYAGDAAGRRSAAWFSGIGQVGVLATPLQMANAHAVIARDGLWLRPTLVAEGLPTDALRPAGPDRRDLHLGAAELAAVKEGMWRVVNTPAGSGYAVRRQDIVLAGKTGTAQAQPFSYIVLDEHGQPQRDEAGRLIRIRPAISTRQQPNPLVPWYRGSGMTGQELSHAWFVGYAPADAPRIAFAVMLEYGGGGGGDAAPIVRELLESCRRHGYL
jgi:penicillin-binding protein 2